MHPRPTLPSIHSLLGLRNRDELDTMLDHYNPAPAHAESTEGSVAAPGYLYFVDSQAHANKRPRMMPRPIMSSTGQPASAGSNYGSDVAFTPSSASSSRTTRTPSPSYQQNGYPTYSQDSGYAHPRAPMQSVLPHAFPDLTYMLPNSPASPRPLVNQHPRLRDGDAVFLSAPQNVLGPVVAAATDGNASVVDSSLIDARSPPLADPGTLLPTVDERLLRTNSPQSAQSSPYPTPETRTSPQSSKDAVGEVVRISPTTSVFPASTSVAKYMCEYCQKRFNRPSSLKIHVNTHTGDKPYPCTFPGCGRCFSVLSNMRRHARVHTQSREASSLMSDNHGITMDHDGSPTSNTNSSSHGTLRRSSLSPVPHQARPSRSERSFGR